ncbi:pilus assembly protein TadE [Anaerobacillus arseniciselenatis]|uniref:Pilus assembly protein TadE n=1 Tax=Anaerobacillus arseniciselenatis TaxID=85682 RepID=A0A1S2LQ43_9BACI|nr:TadE family protein [Anaerobacillus arseniciselenatis]OIJ14638.1 pilus assembly protein TadE [Anaerobacillus arseniciselenatis]
MIKDEKGQSMVEMALLLPILLLLLVGIFDLGRVLYTNIHLHLATQETVRLGGLGASDEEMKQFAKNYVHVGDVSLLDVAVQPPQAERVSGEYVTVVLEYPIEFFTPFISRIIPPFSLQTNSTIRVE